MSEEAPPYVADATVACPFCRVDRGRIAWSSPLAIALWDVYPVSLGHALVVPRRHAASWSELTADEKAELTAGVDAVRALIDERYQPYAYNVGYNDGEAAGQTIMHFHVHVIPRYQGDVLDPRGGIRWVLPDKAAYWLSTEP
ncbi:MAG TPA: HIT family protein [Gammaproteobacteria bacterium]|nr:HIT family protein [Gammaproteobacteria bacterium]